MEGYLNKPKGTSLARAAMALASAKGQQYEALDIAATRWPDDIFCTQYIKGSIAAQTTADGILAYATFASADFAALLRSGTILGRLTGVRRVPLNIKYPRQTSGSTVAWVGEGNAVPVSKEQLDQNTLGIAKIGGIVVITNELAGSSDPVAEELVRNSLTAGATAFLDAQFIDPGVAAVANVSPASITNGITPTQSTGSTALLIAADLATLLTTLADQNETDALYWVMTRSDAARLAAKRDTAGAPAFPDIKANGTGFLLGIPVIASNAVPHSTSAGSIVALVNAAGVDYGDLSAIEIDVASHGALQLDSAPTNSSSVPTATTFVSLFQTDSAAIKLTAYRNYRRVRDTAVTYLDNVHW